MGGAERVTDCTVYTQGTRDKLDFFRSHQFVKRQSSNLCRYFQGSPWVFNIHVNCSDRKMKEMRYLQLETQMEGWVSMWTDLQDNCLILWLNSMVSSCSLFLQMRFNLLNTTEILLHACMISFLYSFNCWWTYKLLATLRFSKLCFYNKAMHESL